MNEADKMESVFGGEDAVNAGGVKDDSSSRIAELERELQRERVESGRLKKANEEIADLRKELEQLRRKNEEADAMQSLPEDVRSALPDEVVRGQIALQAKADERHNREIDELRKEIARRDEAYAQRDRVAFAQNIERKYPGFMASIGTGGANCDKWRAYQQYNASSIKDAYDRRDFAMLSYHIDKFCRESDLDIPSGNTGDFVTPDPRSTGGGAVGADAVKSGKVYTQEEFLALYDQVEEARERGDFAEMKRLNSEIQKAPAEGRVK